MADANSSFSHISLGVVHISLDAVRGPDSWITTDENPTGSLEKLVLTRVDDGAHFIFKYPKERREHQIWSELVAAFIAGDLLSWDVQHVSLGILHGRPGNLLKYIYSESEEYFIEGRWFCQEVDSEYDVGKGTRHTLPLIVSTFDNAIGPNDDYDLDRADFMGFWSRAFAFDALISNTDRHAENWGIVTSPSGTDTRMAALYDNASSLGCNIEKIGLRRFFTPAGMINPAKLESYARNGCHHVRLEKAGPEGARYVPLCKAFLAHYPEGRAAFEEAEAIDLDRVRNLLDLAKNTVDLPESSVLTEERIVHICAVLNLGMERIRDILRN